MGSVSTNAAVVRQIITSDKQQCGELLALAVEADLPLGSALVLVALWSASDHCGVANLTQPELCLLTGLSMRGVQNATKAIPEALLRRARPPRRARSMGRKLRYEVATPEHRLYRQPSQVRRGLPEHADTLPPADPRQQPLPGVCAVPPRPELVVVPAPPAVLVPVAAAPVAPSKPAQRPPKRSKGKAKGKRAAKVRRGRKGGAR